MVFYKNLFFIFLFFLSVNTYSQFNTNSSVGKTENYQKLDNKKVVNEKTNDKAKDDTAADSSEKNEAKEDKSITPESMSLLGGGLSVGFLSYKPILGLYFSMDYFSDKDKKNLTPSFFFQAEGFYNYYRTFGFTLSVGSSLFFVKKNYMYTPSVGLGFFLYETLLFVGQEFYFKTGEDSNFFVGFGLKGGVSISNYGKKIFASGVIGVKYAI